MLYQITIPFYPATCRLTSAELDDLREAFDLPPSSTIEEIVETILSEEGFEYLLEWCTEASPTGEIDIRLIEEE